MSIFQDLATGILAALTLTNLIAALLGGFFGTLLGVVPGIGSVTGAAILIPFTFTLEPLTGLIAICAMYYGVIFGGSTTSILLNIPGDASSIITAIEGNQLARRGRAGQALGIVAVASIFGGVVSLLLMSFVSEAVSRVALGFGAAEYFALTLGGLIILARLFGGKPSEGLLPLVIGLLLGTVGLDPASGTNRFIFGVPELSLGIGIVAVAAGIFGVSEISRIIARNEKLPPVHSVKFRDIRPSKDEFAQAAPAIGRGTILGFVMGLLPGPSITLSTFMSYKLENGIAKGEARKKFGQGSIAGLAGPEGANNAAATSAMIPVLLLGLPFSATLALVLVALRVHGIEAGPRIQIDHPELFWGLIAAMIIGNIMLFVMNFNFIRLWVSMLKVPTWILMPVVLMTAGVGVYVSQSNILDVVIFVLTGLLGFVLVRFKFHLAPLLLGVLLGPMVETYFIQGISISSGDLTYFVSRPIAVGMWVLTAVILFVPPAWSMVRHALTKRQRNSLS